MTEVVDRTSGPPTWPRVRRLSGGALVPLSHLLVLLIVLSAQGATLTGSDGEGQHYTNQWAVRVDGTEADARRLAERHGFVYVDKVRIHKFFDLYFILDYFATVNAYLSNRCFFRTRAGYNTIRRHWIVIHFKPPPPVGAGGGYMFSGRPSVPLSVRASVRPSVVVLCFRDISSIC